MNPNEDLTKFPDGEEHALKVAQEAGDLVNAVREKLGAKSVVLIVLGADRCWPSVSTAVIPGLKLDLVRGLRSMADTIEKEGGAGGRAVRVEMDKLT